MVTIHIVFIVSGRRKKSIYAYNVSTSSKYSSRYDKFNLKNEGINYNTTMEVSVDYTSKYAVATAIGKRTVKVYKLQDNYNQTFSDSNKIREFKIAHPSNIQGGDLCGQYYYYLWGHYNTNSSKKTYINCYDITTGKLKWSTEIPLGDRIRSLLNTSYKNLEPEGIKVYYYKGSYKIFVGFKVNNYRSAIFYFDC